MGPFWYAQYNKSDKVVVGAGFVPPESLQDETHDVTVGFEAPIPPLRQPGQTPTEWVYLKKYNEQTQQLEDNV